VIKSRDLGHATEFETPHRILTFETELLHNLLKRGIQNLLGQEPEREQKPNPRVEFGRETVAGYARGQNGSHVMVRKPDSGVLRMLGLCSECSSSTPACSPSAQVKQQFLTSVPQTETEPANGQKILRLGVSM